MIYIFDAQRVREWRAAFPNACFVHELAPGCIPELSPDDVVFAHTHKSPKVRDPDFFLGDTQPNPTHGMVYQEFVLRVRDAVLRGQAPWVISYSGDNLTARDAQIREALIIGTVIPNFPADRVLVMVGTPICREITASKLRERADLAAATLGLAI